MRFRHRDGISVHLSYSTGVHPAETPDGLLAHLRSSSTARPPNSLARDLLTEHSLKELP